MGEIAQSACKGKDTCINNNNNIGMAACIGDHACFQNLGTIEFAACWGNGACKYNSGKIESGCCDKLNNKNYIPECDENSGTIGPGKNGCECKSKIMHTISNTGVEGKRCFPN